MKKTISLILCLAMIMSTVAFSMPAFAVLDFTAEKTEDFAKTEDPAELSGTKGQNDGKPGYNIITGTKDAYGFEDGYRHAVLIKRTAEIKADPDDAKNHVMWLGNTIYSNIGLTPLKDGQGDFTPLMDGKRFEDERPLHVNFKLKGDFPSNIPIEFMSGLDNANFTSQGGTSGWSNLDSFYITDGMNWVEKSTTVTYGAAKKSANCLLLCFLMSKAGVTGNAYIDDISIIPDYRVVFYDNDGKTVLYNEYVSYKEYGNNYTFDEAAHPLVGNGGKEYFGFKLKGTDDEAIISSGETFKLLDEDIEFVAVANTTLNAPSSTSGKDGEVFTINSKKPVTEWSVDDTTLLTIKKSSEKSIELAAHGYSGIVKVTAKGDGFEETAEIRLTGGTKWRPGANLATGTFEPVTFENSWEQITSTNLLKVVDAKDGNTSAKMVAKEVSGTSGQTYFGFNWTALSVNDYEKARPLRYEVKYKGVWNNIWAFFIDGSNSQFSGGKSPDKWTTYVHNFSMHAKSNTNYMQFGMNHADYLYMDDVSLTPYYKVTYKDAFGEIASSEYVLPEDRILKVKDDLDETFFEGYALEGTTEAVTEVKLAYSDVVLVPVAKEGVEFAEASEIYANGEKTTDIDPRFPGVVYVFDEEIVPETITAEEIAKVGGGFYEYYPEDKALVIYPAASTTVAGKKIGYNRAFTSIKTKSGKCVIFNATEQFGYASTVPNDGKNMLPFGDMESGYLPYYETEGTGTKVFDIDVATIDGNTRLEARANSTIESYPHVSTKTVVEAGATYKLFADLTSLGTKDDETATSNVFFNVIYNGDVTGDLKNHGSIDNYHVLKNEKEIAAEVDFAKGASLSAEFTVSALDDDAEYTEARVSVFSEPNNGHVTGFAIDNLELYRKTNVIYKPNASVKADDVDAPAADGAFILTKGGVETGDKIIVAANPYEAIDSKRKVDGWKSTTDNIVYKAGDEIDLAKVELDSNGDYVLLPNIVGVDGKPLLNVIFTGDVKNRPDNLIGAYCSGDVVKMADFYKGVSSAIEGKRFNGWSTTGKIEDIVPMNAEITITDNIEFKAIVNYDINFAIEANHTPSTVWASNGEITYEDGYAKATHKVGASSDVNFSVNGLAVPAGDVYQIIWWVDPEFITYSDKDHTGEPTVNTITNGKWFEGLFFSHPGQGDSAGRNIGCSAQKTYTTPSGKQLVGIVATTTASSSWEYNNNIAKLRFDPNNIFGNLNYRYIQFVEFPKHDVDTIAVTGVDAPIVGAVPDTTASCDSIAKVTSVKWSPEIEYGYDENTEYTVSVTIASVDTSKQFKKDVKVTINGVEADSATVNADNSITANYTFPATGEYIKFDMSISGPEAISKAGRTTQYKVNFSTPLPLETATWSIDPEFEAYAAIDAVTGKLVPYMNCDELKIYATSNYNRNVVAEYTVKLENQGTVTIHYDANTTAAVKNMPADEESGKLAQLSTQVPTRDGYIFAGWSTEPTSRETIEFITVEQSEITVYAVWNKVALAFEFEGKDSRTILNGGWVSENKVQNGYLQLSTNADGGDIRVLPSGNGSLGIPNSACRRIEMKVSYSGFDATPQIFVNKLDAAHVVNASLVSAKSTDLETYAIYEFNLTSKLAGEDLNSFWMDPFDRKSSTCRIDYIRFFDANRTLTFNANTSDEVTLPDAVAKAVGTNYTVTETAEREGYKFLGWSASADSVELVSKIYLGEDLELFAVWAANATADEDGKYILAGTDEEALVISAPAGTDVTVTVKTEDGDKTITGKTDDNGNLVVDLSGIDGEITGIEVVGDGVTGVIATSKDTADAITATPDEEEKENTSSDILINGKDKDGNSGSSSKKWDTTVTDVTKPGTITPKADDEDGEEAVDIKSIMASEGDILLNFDNEAEKEFFASTRQMTLGGVSDSVITYTNKGLASGSNDAPSLFTATFALDADAHRYVVIKARYSSDNAVQMYFTSPGVSFSEAKKKTAKIGTEYSMLVYDMSDAADWKGTVSQLFFSFATKAGETAEIDWILFTNEVPADMSDIAGTLDRFPTVNKGDMKFADVKEADWFYSEVLSAYRLGFVTGISETAYAPDGQVTIAEAITLAVRLNYAYNGKELPAVAEGAEWYSNYVNAAVRASIIKLNQFADYNAPAARRDVANMMYKALPRDYLEAINMFTSIPDVTTKDSAYGAVRALYNAGVVIGSDAAYNFYPDSNITRAEMAAIVNRMAIPANRKRVVTEAEIESRKKYYYAEDLEVASLGNCYANTFSIKDGLATGKGKTGDPIVYLTNVLGQLNGKEVTKITVGAKWDFTAQAGTPQMFFTTPTGGWSAERMLRSTKGDMKDGIQEFVFTTSSNAQFANTVTALRFDPFDAKDIEFSIAYIIVE